MAIVLPATFTAVDKFSSVVMRMDKSVGTFATKTEARVNRVNRAFRKLTPSLGKIGKQLLAFASITVLVSGLMAATNVAIDFEQANADLAAVMNTTVEKNILLSKEAERLGGVTAKTASEVVSLQEAYARLGFSQAEIINVTEATINGSVAMNSQLSETAELTGAVIRTFDKFSSVDASDILDKMTLSTQKSALNFEKLNSALPNVAGAAQAAGVGFDTLLALLGKLSDAGIDAAASGTALKNIFIKAKAKGADYNQILKMISKSSDKLTSSNKSFGKIAAVSGTILANKLKEVDDLTNKLSKDFKGVADEAAKKRLDTLRGGLTLLNSAWEGLIIKLSTSTGAMESFKNKVDFVTRNLETILKTIKWVVIAFVAMKAILLLTSGALFAYNVVLGITAALSGGVSLAVGKSAVALGAYKTMLALVTAAQWLWAIALNVGIWPLTLIALGIAATIALITVIIKKWDTWGAALTIFMGPLGLIISMFQSFRRNWEMIKESFRTGGIVAGLKAIGVTLLDAVLMPLQQLLEIISKVPGSIGDFAAKGALKIETFREGLGVNTGDTNKAEPVKNINLDQTKQEVFSEQITRSIQEQNLNINVNDPNNRTDTTLNGQPIPINLSPVL